MDKIDGVIKIILNKTNKKNTENVEELCRLIKKFYSKKNPTIEDIINISSILDKLESEKPGIKDTLRKSAEMGLSDVLKTIPSTYFLE